jgi:hypothetical protein
MFGAAGQMKHAVDGATFANAETTWSSALLATVEKTSSREFRERPSFDRLRGSHASQRMSR